MIAVELDRGTWPDTTDWQGMAQLAVEQAILESAHANMAAWARLTAEISIRLTSDAEVQALNHQYRGKDKPTNVLSFPMLAPDEIAALTDETDFDTLLGDIVLARETCAREAAERGVPLEDHAAHLIVHGTLHLIGHDHMKDAEAEAMEAIERAAMAALGLHDPYPIED